MFTEWIDEMNDWSSVLEKRKGPVWTGLQWMNSSGEGLFPERGGWFLTESEVGAMCCRPYSSQLPSVSVKSVLIFLK